MKRTITPALTYILFLIFFITQVNGQTILVDFGNNASSNYFGLSGWNQLLLSPNMSYYSSVPYGVFLSSQLDEFTDFMGVKGTARKFNMGERIVVTWYNNSDDIISFTARISFVDENYPSENSADGNWFTMRSFDDYRITYTQIQPRSTAKTVFNITDSGVHKSDEIYSVINVNLTVEWFDSFQKQFLICDKIELFGDADITPPDKPVGLTATVLSDSKIRLDWDIPNDNVGVAEYLIYNNDRVEGYSRENSFIVGLLEPYKNYEFRVSAIDKCQNESIKSDPVNAATLSYQGKSVLISPQGIEYLGAVKLPEIFSYGGDGLAYNPNGDGGVTGPGSSDGYSGSLFITDINIPERGYVAEVSLPAPVISATKNLDEINEVQILQGPVNIRPDNINSWDYVDVWLTGLEYVEEENRLYNSWAIYYDVIGDKTASLSCVDANNLGGTKYGAWYFGSANNAQLPIDTYLNDYLFQVPQYWADANLNGRSLISGRYREGGLSGLGPTFYAVNAVGNNIPSPNTELPFSTLLQYGAVEGTDNYNYPNSMTNYNHADWWKDADWISVESQSSIALIGNKALGNNWYGYNGENMRHDWIIADQPYPEFYLTDPIGKGWKSDTKIPMIALYDPEDLALVANGNKNSFEPQPYSVIRLNENIFWSQNKQINSSEYDHHNNILFITEFDAPSDGRLLIHLFKMKFVEINDLHLADIPHTFKLEQNYPNPFNPITTIKFEIPETGYVSLKIYDLLGKEISTLINELKMPGIYEVKFDGTNLASGIYFYQLKSGDFVQTKKLILMK